MYQRKSNLLNIVIMILDCICITVSLILANYIRNGKAFVSDNARMDFGLMLGGCLVAFLAWNLYKNLYKILLSKNIWVVKKSQPQSTFCFK